MRRVSFFSLKPELSRIKGEVMRAIEGVLDSGKFIMDENVRNFEKEIASYFGVKYAVSVNSGTDALVISLRACGVKPGDEVITTAFTFFATAEAISIIGAKPVFVDIKEDTFNIDPDLIEEKISSKTKAIIPVHLFGLPADMERIMSIARKCGLKVVEDNAQAFGAQVMVNGKFMKTGSIGDAGAFSFFPTKNLGAYGDGGIILTNDDEIFEICSMLKNHGSKVKYYNEMLGYNSRLDEIQAAILRVKLKYVDQFNDSRLQIAKLYMEALREVEEVIKVPFFDSTRYKHVFHQYSVLVKRGSRDDLRQYLKDKGIDTFVYYPYPLHKLPVYRDLNYSLPVTEGVCERILSLPVHQFMDLEDAQYVADNIKNWVLQRIG
ncbi:MAG: DegT/DnrJ/EryC1/StrS family aminotransferase [bacterium]